jgi:hypothetical protein
MIGKHFEEMVMDLFDHFNRHALLPFVFTRIGSWWHRGEEIDIVLPRRGPRNRSSSARANWQDDVDAAEVYF